MPIGGSHNAQGEASPPIRSGGRPPRTFSLSNLLSELVYGSSSERKEQPAGQQQAPIRRQWSAGDVDGIARCPYSAVLKNPHVPSEFHMPVHYPRFTKEDYEKMPEWQLDRLLEEYGIPAHDLGDVNQKRRYAMGAFLWKE